MNRDQHGFDQKVQVLILEHDPALQKIMRFSLQEAGVSVKAVSKSTNALEILKQTPPDVLIVDFELHDGDAGRLIRYYRAHPEVKDGIVIVSTTDRLDDSWRHEYKPDSVIYKPFDIRYLIRLILSSSPKHRFLSI